MTQHWNIHIINAFDLRVVLDELLPHSWHQNLEEGAALFFMLSVHSHESNKDLACLLPRLMNRASARFKKVFGTLKSPSSLL